MAKAITSESIYNQIFDRILSDRYAPHVRLKEMALAREFRVSRTPIREVLRQLAQDGLVRLVPRYGVTVVSLTTDEVEEIYDIRKALETLAIDYAVNRMNLQTLVNLRHEVKALARTTDVARHAAFDNRLHSYIVETCQRPRLTTLLQQQYRLMQRFRYLGFREKAVIARTTMEHGCLIDALLQRDADTARAVLAKHIESTKAVVLAKLFQRAPVAN